LTIKRVLVTTLLTALLVVAAAGFFWWQKMLRAAQTPGAATTAQIIDIAPGASLRSALRQLQQQQLIGDARNLELYLRCCKQTLGFVPTDIKAGRYRIEAGTRPIEVLRQLVAGKVLQETVTIVEGWTFSQMRAALTKQAGLKQTVADRSDADIMRMLGAANIAAEGRFAPDTYSFASTVTSDLDVLRMAYKAQQKNLEEAWASRQAGSPLRSPDDALTLASIVEKETGLASERARVAGVYTNRLRIGMRLQSDPTVIYGIRDRYDGNIRKRDLTTDTPYNTYTRVGLPPTPIALPGRSAIIAAVNPEHSDELYFVAMGDGSGASSFSATLAQHNLAVQRYLQRLRRSEPAVSNDSSGAR
jgi:UPF0755 protein